MEGLKSRGESTYDLMKTCLRYIILPHTHILFGRLNFKGLCDDGEDITLEHLMTEYINKYKVLLSMVKWKAMST